MAESGGATIFHDFGAALDGIGQGSKETPVKSAPSEGMAGRRAAPPKGWRWAARNWWRLSLGCAVGGVVLVVGAGRVFPFGDLGRGAASWVVSWRGGGHPLGSSRFDDCWAGGPSPVCGPSLVEARSLLVVAALAVAVVLLWWRVAEMPAAGERAVGRWVRRRRQARVLRKVRDQWRAAVIELKWLSPPTKCQAFLAKVGLHPKGPYPACEIRSLRRDMVGGVVADLKYRRLVDTVRFEKPKNVGQLMTTLAFETGHRRRLRGPWWLRPLLFPAAVAAGERRYVLQPRDIFFGEHPLGGQHRLLRLVYPTPDADLLVADPEPAPDHSRVRLALGQDVVYWDKDKHPHLGIFGPTDRGKGHVERRVIWQLIQVGQLVCMVDGQAGSEHGLFRGLPNYWWFDPIAYQDTYGAAGLAPWVLDSLSVEERALLFEVPAALNHQLAHLVYVRNQLRALVALGWQRNLIADRNLGQGWHEWSAADKAANPRVNLVLDETNTLLGKGNGPGRLGEGLRKEIGALIGVLLFGGRKYGIHVALGAQILYSASWMARGMYAQIGFVVAMGNVPPQHQLMTTQVTPWPGYPDEKGYGVAVAYANRATIETVRFPPAYPTVYAPLVQALREATAVTTQPDPPRVADS